MQEQERHYPPSQDTNTLNLTGREQRPKRRTALAPHEAQIQSWVEEKRSDAWIAGALGTSASSIQSFRSRRGMMRGTGDRPRVSEESSKGGSNEASDGSSKDASVYEGVLEHGEEEGYGLWLDPAVAEDPNFKANFQNVSDVEVSIQRDRIVLRAAGGSTPSPQTAGDSDLPREAQPGLADLVESAESLTVSNRERGEVKWFEPEKGYGFIFRPGGEEIFVHKSAIKDGSTLTPGLEISYEVDRNQRGLVAEDVKPVD